MISSVVAHYEGAVSQNAIRADVGQLRAAYELDALLQQMTGEKNLSKRKWFRGFRPNKSPSTGVYLWGDVGRGKSMLMDIFFAVVREKFPTRRAHFHAFMLDIHKRMFLYRQQATEDVIARVVHEIANETTILCLDEFQVSDRIKLTAGLRIDMPYYPTTLDKNPRVDTLVFAEGAAIDVSARARIAA